MIFELLLALLSVLLSVPGMVLLGLGLISFIALPVVPKATGACHWINRLYLHLATAPIKRAAVVVSEHNDAVFKTMKFDARGVEKITLDGETKDFEDPDGALHYWMGMPFALADEVHGLLFDPRHAALGQRKSDLRERDEDEFYATTEEWNEWDITRWKPGVFGMPKTHEMVDLSKIRELAQGGERAEFPTRVEKLYRNSRMPFAGALSSMKLLMPAVAFILVFGGLWIIITRLGGSDGGGSSTVTYGFLAYLFVTNAASSGGGKDWREIGTVGLVVLLPLASIALLVVLFGPIYGFVMSVIFGMGFWFLPIIATLSRPITPVANIFSTFFFTLGFLGYQKPVFEWTPRKYVIREYDDLETTENVCWYGLFNSLVGFTYAPDKESWGAEYLEHEEIEGRKETRPGDVPTAATDGGVSGLKSNLPKQFEPVPSMRRDTYGAFVPRTLKRSKYYLHSGIATARFNNSASGEKSLRRLLEAKEEGENSLGISDKVLLYATCAGGLLGGISGVLVFIL